MTSTSTPSATKAHYMANIDEVALKNITKHKNPRQASIDAFWIRILYTYFEASTFLVEGQPYVKANSQVKANAAVTVDEQRQLKKALILEAKRFPDLRSETWWTIPASWNSHKNQLKSYMTKARTEDKWKYTMYGIVSVGDRVKFFTMAVGSYTLVPYKADDVALGIHTDGILIESILREIIQEIINRE